MRRVVVTGVGAVGGFGATAGALWKAASKGSLSVGLAEELEPFHPKPVGRVDPSAVHARLGERQVKALDPLALFALMAAQEAAEQAGLGDADVDPRRLSCFVGSAAGPQVSHDRAAVAIYREGRTRVHPMTLPRCMFSSVASHVARSHGIMGAVHAVSSACASGTHAIGQALQHIRAGLADIAFAGGSEACLTPGCLASWQALPVLAADGVCRPFSRNRSGIVLAEGAGMLVLEEADHARRRGAAPLAEVAGFGASSDAGSLTGADDAGMARAMAGALADAGIAACEVSHVNAHGTGTALNDVAEHDALRALLGAGLDKVPVTATKSVVGHMLGAGGAVEAIVATLSLKEQFVPPTIGFDAVDPECPLDCIPWTGRPMALDVVLSNSFAFGGLNGALVMRNV